MAIDVTEVCGYPFPVDFLKLLASTIVVKADGSYGFNVTVDTAEACDCTPVLDCNNTEQWASLLPLGFGLDGCGNLAIKLINCDGTIIQNQT